MFAESLPEYLETVAEYIFDNDKLVTYKWLSKELEVHVNVAKQILWEFWQRYKKEKDFNCTFLLIGILHDGGMRVEIVREKDLLTAKEKYSKIISEHIYSLQKVLPEIQLLGLTENGDIKFSAIKCIQNNDRNDEEMHMFRWGTMSREVESVPQEKTQSISEPVKEKQILSPEEKQIAKKKNADRKGFDSLFGKVNSKQKSPLVSSNTETMEVDASNHTKEISKNVGAGKKKNVKKGESSGFFQPNKNHTKTTDFSDKNKSSNSSDKDKSTNSLSEKIVEEKVISKSNSKQKQNVRGKKRNRSKDTKNTVKKRKRITIQSDSSGSESSDNEQGSELDLPSSPENAPAFVKKCSVSPPQVKLENGKRKVLKTVDKTFEEDGFLVTKKVHVYESCSEEEPEIVEVKNQKKIVAPESLSEVKGKKNTKQTTLMNFFKKS
ncbi:DNA polymerase delta subunit 3-like [Bombus pyrosoma]|uniref:DNA polymerase delta subunit 3-like n=1 Tax=Bombus pyrosoma TaxID=396416 RepID=UPI001CB9CEAF|nr:DNA polymerase delta subunit 3-like [Bombus pyrosoma]